MKINVKDSAGIIYGGFEDDDQELRLCPDCLKPLGERLYKPTLPNEPKQELPRDHDLWLQCHNCGQVYAKWETKVEDKIKEFAEITQNPHDVGRTVQGLDNKKKKSRTQRERERRRERIERETDEDIKRELRKGTIVTIIEDSLDY